MELSTLITISCVLTGITMVFFVSFIAVLLRYGSKGVTGIFNRLLGRDDISKGKSEDVQIERQRRPAVSSSQSLRQRAQGLDFPVPTATQQFGAQSAQQQGQYPNFPPPAQPSLRPRIGQDQFGSGRQQFQPQAQEFRPSTPSLSPSRPFNAAVTQPAPPTYPQGIGQQGGLRPQVPHQQGGFNAQSQPGFGQAPPPRQASLGQQRPPQQAPRQGGFGQQRPLQQAPQQGGFGQQRPSPQANFGQARPPQQGSYGQPPAPQQGGLGQNRPPLQSRPRPTDTTGRRQFSPRRDDRRHDDYERIYDEGDYGDIGDVLDNF